MPMKWFFYYANVICLSQTLSDEQIGWNLEVVVARNNFFFYSTECVAIANIIIQQLQLKYNGMFM